MTWKSCGRACGFPVDRQRMTADPCRRAADGLRKTTRSGTDAAAENRTVPCGRPVRCPAASLWTPCARSANVVCMPPTPEGAASSGRRNAARGHAWIRTPDRDVEKPPARVRAPGADMSARPDAPAARTTVLTFAEKRRRGEPISMVTAYDFPTARMRRRGGRRRHPRRRLAGHGGARPSRHARRDHGRDAPPRARGAPRRDAARCSSATCRS